MDNLKYYSDSFAYDFNMFLPAEKPEKQNNVIDYPQEIKKSSTKVKAVQSVGEIIKTVLIIGAVLFSIVGSVYLRARITSVNTEINVVQKHINEAESEITRLQVEIDRKISINGLEAAATELGMQKRERSQNVYLNTITADKATNKSGELSVEAYE